MSHAELQDLLSTRYYISPSRLYSVIRALPSNQGYEVPVDDDWATIAVVAERSPVKLTSGPIPQDQRDGSFESRQPRVGKKFVSLRLVDLGRRDFDACGAKSGIHGDALLNMIMFESAPLPNSAAPGCKDKRYSTSGSGGAYEEGVSLTAGAVIAVLNPQILKPLTVGMSASILTGLIICP